MSYTIGRLAKKHGLSRSALLYYDKVGLLRPSSRGSGGYRFYDESDDERLRQILLYRSAGVSLEDIKTIFAASDSQVKAILQERFEALNQEISTLHQQQHIIARLLKNMDMLCQSKVMTKQVWCDLLRSAGFSEEDMRQWHVLFEDMAPEKHRAFLAHLRLDDDEIERIRKWAQYP